MEISQALQRNKQILTKTSNTPQIDAEVLLCFVLKKSKEFLYTYPEYELTEKEIKDYSDCIKKRLKNIPVAYITGFKKFYGRKFIVTNDTLVPRPETEMMVNHIVHNTQHATHNTQHVTNNITIIDVGTGSGCVIVSLAKELENDLRFIAIDISKKALEVARKNARKHGVGDVIEFYHGNLLEPLFSSSQILSFRPALLAGRNHFKSDNHSNFKGSHHSAFAPLKMTKKIIITANLPYLTPKQIKNAPSIHNEPELALVAGNDGLKYYKELFKQINNFCHCEKELERRRGNPANQATSLKKQDCHVAPTPRNDSADVTLLCEIDNSQKDAIINLAKKELPNFSAEIKKDLAGLFRMLILKN
ncbi:peptide chain release factor N(5)-glutamine methyltransferase [Candidatus Parcubacteria bacterium]|nr:peptide chain release factor N(5)-glutamine methyltransferase [Candidatus Parcubacteria bacterium]